MALLLWSSASNQEREAMKVMMWTPLLPEREKSPFLEPCRQFRRDLVRKYKIVAVEDRTFPEGLGAKNERGRQIAIAGGFTHMLYIEDDETADLEILAEFEKCLEETGGKVAMAVIPMRPVRTLTRMNAPLIWHYEHPYPVINDRILTCTQAQKDYGNRTPIKIEGGSVCSPMLVSLDIDLPFHGADVHKPEEGPPWDFFFSQELRARFIPFYCLNWIHTKHYCDSTKNIYE